jgi:hypothetical protein
LVPEFDPDDPENPVLKIKHGTKAPSNKFQVIIGFITKKSDTQGDISLQWFERSDRLPSIYVTAGLKPGVWNDIQDALTTSQAKVRRADGRPPKPSDKDKDLTTVADYVKSHQGTATYWPRQYLNNKAKQCPTRHGSVFIEDEPSAFMPRKLDFHIVVKNPDNCGCTAPQTLELYATQLIRAKKNSKPDDPADTSLSRIYGPNGEAGTITGQAPVAPQPKLP